MYSKNIRNNIEKVVEIIPDLDVPDKFTKMIRELPSTIATQIKEATKIHKPIAPPKYIAPDKFIELPPYYKWDQANGFCHRITGVNKDVDVDATIGGIIYDEDILPEEDRDVSNSTAHEEENNKEQNNVSQDTDVVSDDSSDEDNSDGDNSEEDAGEDSEEAGGEDGEENE